MAQELKIIPVTESHLKCRKIQGLLGIDPVM